MMMNTPIEPLLNKHIKPVFFAYISRSGSTLIAKHLNTFAQIEVTPEANIYGLIKESFRNVDELYKAIDRLYIDERFLTWNVDRNELEKLFVDSSYPITFKSFHDKIIELFAKRNKKAEWVLSKSSVAGNIYKILAIYPNSPIIFVYRDIRAICNSLNNTFNPHTNKYMKANVFMLAFTFNRIRRLNKRNLSNLNFVKYEEFVENTDSILDDLSIILKVEKIYKENDYAQVLSDNQKLLHKNLNKPNDIQRTFGWIEELDNTYIFLLQLLSYRTLKYFNYEKVTIKMNTISIKILYREIVEFIFSKKAGIPFMIKTMFNRF